MIKKNYLDKIKNTNWYRQGGAIKLFYVSGPYHCVNETIGYDGNIVYQDGEINTAFFDRDREAEKTRWIIKKQIQDKHFIDYWIKDWEKKILATLAYAGKSFKKPVDQWTDAELVRFLEQFRKLWLESWKKGILLEWTDPDGQAILQKTIKKYGVDLSPGELEVFLSPEKLTFVQEELISWVAIARQKKRGKDIEKEISRHAKQFHWYQNTWAYVHELDSKYFEKLIQRDLRVLKQRMEEVKEIKRNLRESKKKKIILYRKKRIPAELKNVLYMFQRMTDWRDYRKKMGVCLSVFYLYQILKRLMKENNFPEKMANVLSFPEIHGWKMSPAAIRSLKRRRQAAYICDREKRCDWYYGKEAKVIFDLLIKSMRQGVLRGAVANKGLVRGTVRIVETKEDFSKMKKGDILVATMTRPEYVSVLKIAGAIVTNEGGITCHAAIVSRELNKPCVIGTQVATEVLKDGDLVEVDANNGVVRKVK